MAKFCPNCGNQLNDFSNICSYCGYNMEIPNNNVIDKKKKKGFASYWGKVVLFILIYYIVVWFLSFLLIFIDSDISNNYLIKFFEIILPIFGLIFSPIIALIIYSVRNKK